MNLPRPTPEELERGNKSDYFARLLESEDVKKLKIPSEELPRWIHKNYDEVLLFDNELTYKQYINSR